MPAKIYRSEHTLSCVVHNLIDSSRKSIYETQYPNFCNHCGGSGAWHHGGSYDEPPDSGPCAFCTEEEKCPRCGKELTIKWLYDSRIEADLYDYDICESCGWSNSEKGQKDPNFQHPTWFGGYECSCWEAEYDRRKKLW